MNEVKVTDGMPQFQIELTDEQNAFIQAFWDKHASCNCLMMAQPQHRDEKWLIRAAMLYDDSAEILGRTFNYVKKADQKSFRLETGE